MTSARASAVLAEAARLVAAGTPLDDGAGQLAAAAPDRAALDEAHVAFAQGMHDRPRDDFTATAILRLVLAALQRVPYEASSGDRDEPASRRGSRRSR